MNVLLTGSSGWLGRFLAPRLRAHGYQVTGLDVAPGPDTAVLGSVADRACVDQLFAEHAIGTVIHCAALHKPDIARYPNQAFVDVNVTGTLNLLEAARLAGHDRFVFTSTTSLLISAQVRLGKGGGASQAYWIDENFGPIQPRNIYGITKHSAEHLCRLYAELHGMDIPLLRTGRFFPEDDDTHRFPSGPNLKANEFLNRRLAVEDVADAHIAALQNCQGSGCQAFILSAPPPFTRADATALVQDAPAVIAHYYPQAAALYRDRGWTLPNHIDRVYDPSKAERLLGFRAKVDFAAVLQALADGTPMPYHHEASYISPKESTPKPA